MEYIGIGIVIAEAIAAGFIIYTKFTKCEDIPHSLVIALIFLAKEAHISFLVIFLSPKTDTITK